MKRQLFLILCTALLITNFHELIGYGLPTPALGASNFLDGGPLRPRPGFYLQHNTRYYHANNFRDACGNTINKDRAIDLNTVVTSFQLIYQRRPGILPHAQTGFVVSLPFIVCNRISCNPLGFNSSGSGIGDIAAGTFLQFNPIMEGDRPIFVHRIEFDAIFPTGKYEGPRKTINPGNNLFYVNPYWSATLYMNPDLATSWRLNYLWAAENPKTGFRPGQAVYVNYTVETRALQKVWFGINGYFLQQLKNNKVCSVEIPNSKEQVFATGFGALYTKTKDDNIFFNIYFECFAKNRPQGMSFAFRYLKHF